MSVNRQHWWPKINRLLTYSVAHHYFVNIVCGWFSVSGNLAPTDIAQKTTSIKSCLFIKENRTDRENVNELDGVRFKEKCGVRCSLYGSLYDRVNKIWRCVNIASGNTPASIYDIKTQFVDLFERYGLLPRNHVWLPRRLLRRKRVLGRLRTRRQWYVRFPVWTSNRQLDAAALCRRMDQFRSVNSTVSIRCRSRIRSR